MTKLQSDPPPALGSSVDGTITSQSSFESSNPDLARVFVRLADGRKIIVSVPQDASVEELHRRALERAARLGIGGTIDNTFLETIGSNNVVVFGDDALIDVIDLTDDNTFSLRSLENTLTSNVGSSGRNQAEISALGEHPSSFPNEPQVYVRWITIEAAMESPRLRRIGIDNVPFSMHTTLSEFHRLAVERLCDGSQKGACTNSSKLILYLRECVLRTENNLATLRDLGVKGGKHNPLDVFVEFTGPSRPEYDSSSLMSAGPKDFWSFDSTPRGMSTFVTSIQILLHEISAGRCNLDSILEILWELTHFPPLLLAFKTLHQTGIGYTVSTDSLLLVASAFYALCGRIAPSKICPSSENWLEASRQVVYWIYSMRPEASLSQRDSVKLIYRARVVDGGAPNPYAPPFMPFQELEMTMATESGPENRKFLVSAETDDRNLCELLGIAWNKSFVLPWDFYFNPVDHWDTLWDHKLSPTLNHNEFNDLVRNTNLDGAFKMIGPLQLGGCLAAQLPVITLSAKGYVSKYEHIDLHCGERSSVTRNFIEGLVTLPDNAGQFLSQKLDPILLERKSKPNWQLDAWPEWTNEADFGVPDEAIIICVDTSGSMECTMPNDWLPNRSTRGSNPSRLTEVQEFFKNLALRISAMNLSTHLGLVTFSSKSQIHVKQPLTPLHLNFNHQLDNISAAGPTAIFDAIYKACAMLCQLKEKHPKTKCRIILLTDGEDNSSGLAPEVVSQLLYKNNIILDAVVIGTKETSELFKIANNTGGYAFSPQTQQALFQIFLLETVVDIKTRPDVVRATYTHWYQFLPKQPDMASQYDFPPCRPHPNLSDYFIALADAERFMSRLSRRAPYGSSGRSAPSIHSARSRLSTASTVTSGNFSRILLGEIKAMIDNPHEYLDVYVSQSNMGFWKVVMQGPPESAYKDGTFLLYVEIGEEFPRKPPSVRFVTPVLHPNITKHGRVCHPIFDREWSPSTKVYQVLQQMYGILMSLEARDAIDPLSALRFWSDEQEGRREIKKYVHRFARRSRNQYRTDIIAHDLSSIGSSSATISSNASTHSGSTVISPTPPSPSHLSNLNPFSNPPSYRSSSSTAGSVSGASIRSSSTASTSTLLGFLNTQRRPQASGTRGRLFGSAAGAGNANAGQGTSDASGNVGGHASAGEAGPVAGERRVSRRASFFGRLLHHSEGSASGSTSGSGPVNGN